jgi:hypothetical protein
VKLADQPIPQLPQANWYLMGALADALSADPDLRPDAEAFRDRLAALELEPARDRAQRLPVAMVDRSGRPHSTAGTAHPSLGRRTSRGDAQERPRRRLLLVPLVVLAALLATGGSVAAWRVSQTPSASVVAGTTTGAAGTPTDALPAEPPVPGDAGSTSGEIRPAAAAVESLAQCRERVRAADRVLREAEVGIGHWAEHVQAQTDAFAGKITNQDMAAIFKRTRLAGPADVERYQNAVTSFSSTEATCQAPAGSPVEVTTAVHACQTRAKAQQPVLRAAENGMADWRKHLDAMQASRMGHVHDAQAVWIKTWRAAPPHLEAWKHSVDTMEAPSC